MVNWLLTMSLITPPLHSTLRSTFFLYQWVKQYIIKHMKLGVKSNEVKREEFEQRHWAFDFIKTIHFHSFWGHFGWIRKRLEETEEEGNPIGRPAVSTNLDPWDLSDTEPPTRQHTLADMRSQHMYSRGLPALASVREDTPKPLDTWGPRESGGLLGYSWQGGDILFYRRRRNVMRNNQRLDPEWYKTGL